MNRALLIIGVPAVIVAGVYAGLLWGTGAGVLVAAGMTGALVLALVLDRRQRQAGPRSAAGRN